MARALTAPELILLRSDMQGTKLYLGIFQPNTIYTALLNGVPASNDLVYEISFDGGVGTLANVKPNMTLYVGTSAGAYDLGMCRIRKAPIAGTFYIGLTSAITWADNCYLTVVDDFDWWAKHAITSSGTLLMDVDVAYSDQHSAFNPVPVLGSHAAVWLDDATVDVLFDASESWVLGSTITGYAWSAPGASASSGMTTATPTITYDTPGCYSVYCTVTAANGKTTQGMRHVFVYDRADNMPATVFQLAQCVGDHDSGGWMFDMSMEAEASLSEIRDRALVVLFAEDWYGSEWTKQSIGPLENRENIVCVGRIVGESIRWDRETGLVHFTVQGPHYWLNKIQAFPIDLSFAGVADVWSEMPYLTVDRALFHILYWHSTAIETMDFYPTNDTLYTTDAKSIATKIWGQLSDIAISKLMAFPGVDRLGRLFIEIDPQMVAEGDRDFPVVMDLTSADWEEGVEFQRVTVQDCSLISLNAQEVDAGGTAKTRYSYAPGRVPLPYGEPESPNQMLCASQADSNSKAGRILGWRVNAYPDIPVVLAQNNRMIDMFPRQYCGFSIAAENSPRGVAFDANLIPRRVAFYYDGEAGYSHPEINFEAETFEQLSANGDIPGIDDLEDISTPPIGNLPELPPLDVLLPGQEDTTLSGPPKVLVHSPNKGFIYSDSFNHEKPIWKQVNGGLTVDQYQDANFWCVCPNGAFYVGFIGRGSTSYLARAPYIGGLFEIIEDYDSMVAKYGTTDNVGLAAFNCNPLVAESVIYLLTAGGGAVKSYIGAGATFIEGVEFTTGTNNGVSITYGLGYWMEKSGDRILITPDGQTIFDRDATDIPSLNLYIRVGTSGTTYDWENSGGFSRSVNNMESSEILSISSFRGVIALDYTGALVISYDHLSTAKKSSDYGSSFSSIGTLPVGDAWAGCYAGGAGTASRWVMVSNGGYIYFSDDFFATAPDDKRGNVLDIDPIASFDMVKVIEF